LVCKYFVWSANSSLFKVYEMNAADHGVEMVLIMIDDGGVVSKRTRSSLRSITAMDRHCTLPRLSCDTLPVCRGKRAFQRKIIQWAAESYNLYYDMLQVLI
jgi:hypothetical protein